MEINYQERATTIVARQNITPTPLFTTLKQLRDKGACGQYKEDGRYRKLVKYLGHDDDDAPISLMDILESNGWDDTLWALKCVRRTPETNTAMRLFAADCAELVQVVVAESEQEKYTGVVDVVRRYAVGEATGDELDAAKSTAWSMAWDAAGSAAWNMAGSAAWSAAGSAAGDAAKTMALDAAGSAEWDAAWSATESACRLMFVARFGD